VTDAFKNTLAWLLIGMIGVFMAMNWATASFTGTEYVPAGNDAFYHARRILDAWRDPAAFYEFDPNIHVPEGSWIAWPWLYDYLVARFLRIAVPVSSGQSPMPVMVYIPVFWAYVTIGLVLAISATLRLPRALQVLAGLSAALLPLNQVLHGVGRIDHHYMEYTFVLLTLLAGLRWLADPGSRARAALLGLALGVAPGFHNAMFVLQIPVLITLFILWARREGPPADSTRFLAGFLMLGSLLVVLPSQPFLRGEFAYYLLSVFHLYIAACTSVLVILMSHSSFSARRLGVIVIAALAMLLPILGQVHLASDFFSHRVARLAIINEARSMLTMATERGGLSEIGGRYSYLVFAVPLVLAGLLIWLYRTRDAIETFFIVFSLFGLTLMIQQFRLHYFGSFGLYLPILAGAGILLRRFERSRNLILIATVAIFAAAFYKPVHERLFEKFRAGLDSHYQVVSGLMPALAELCREDPGIVFAWNDVGHYVRFHTECSVIANNFLLTPQHSEKVREIDRLASLNLDDFLLERPDIRYLLVHYPTLVAFSDGGGIRLLSQDELKLANHERPLLIRLLAEPDPRAAFPQLEFVHQVILRLDGEELVAARLFVVKSPSLTGEAGEPANRHDTDID
jgi:hypothetical protein